MTQRNETPKNSSIGYVNSFPSPHDSRKVRRSRYTNLGAAAVEDLGQVVVKRDVNRQKITDVIP